MLIMLMGLYEVPLSMSLLDGGYVSQLPYVWYYVVVKSSFKHACELRVQEDLCVLGA